MFLVVTCSGLFSVCGKTFGFSCIFFPITIPVGRCAKMFFASWEIFLVAFCSLSVFWSLSNSPGVICAFSATSTNKSHAFAFWKLPLADGFLTMLFRSGLSSEAVCIDRADMKLAPWFRALRVCGGGLFSFY